MALPDAKIRMIALIFYLIALFLVQGFFIETGLSQNQNSVWFYSGIASLLFGSRLLNPYFTAPADSLMNAFAALLAFIPALDAVPANDSDAVLFWAIIVLCVSICVVSMLVLIFRPAKGLVPHWRWSAFDRAVKGLGSPNVLFTLLIIAATWLFHRDRPIEVFSILTTLAVVTVLQPIEATTRFVVWVRGLRPPEIGDNIIGAVVAHQSPGIVLVRQALPGEVKQGSLMIVSDEHGPPQLGVALNYVGRDEGNLLRVLTTPMTKKMLGDHTIPATRDGIALAAAITMSDAEKSDIAIIDLIDRLAGIVDSETVPDHLQFEVVEEAGLSEGRLVETRIGDQRSVIFQVVDGITREEVVQQKNKYGYPRASARKIGVWDNASNKFRAVPWMPRMNAPVFMLESDDQEPAYDCVGRFPKTQYGVTINASDCVTHNTAVLGILGVGKSYLAIELVERMIGEGIKVICLDLTSQYDGLLSEFIDPAYDGARFAKLDAVGRSGTVQKNREEGGSKRAFKAAVLAEIRTFLSPGDDHYLWVVNPAQFRVTKQISYMDRDGTAETAHLTPSEITAIFSEMALLASQGLGMTDKARLCLVYEEAHSLVPEWNSVASDGDKTATAMSARAILQGRKFGLGCLLVTQRTANVTKSILNQCNTIFAMRTFDDTGKEFLSNYIGSDYASVLPSLEARHAVVFGKASSCENPVLIRLNDQDAFRKRFRASTAPKIPKPAPTSEPIAEPESSDASPTDMPKD